MQSRFNFTSRYSASQGESTPDDELDEYFNMKRVKEWDGCDPVAWWGNHAAQFPNLSKLARDILSIPGNVQLIDGIVWCLSGLFVLGSAVAVERIFSGGRDTISLRRASLKPQTISTLMIVKQSLRKQQ